MRRQKINYFDLDPDFNSLAKLNILERKIESLEFDRNNREEFKGVLIQVGAGIMIGIMVSAMFLTAFGVI